MRLTPADAELAHNQWCFNCGPGALCAILDKTPAEVKPHMGDFPVKGYTNPTLMIAALRSLGVSFQLIHRLDTPTETTKWPTHGLVRVQWAGPWTGDGVPILARYRYTHWIAVRGSEALREVFDINALHYGGWLPFEEWRTDLVPWLLDECYPRANGEWWPTHCFEVQP